MIRVSPLVRAALADYRTRLEGALVGRRIELVLFGSTARAEATEDSDIDVLIVAEPLGAGDRTRILDLGGEIGMDHGLPISPIALSGDEWSALVARERGLATEIVRDGIEL